MIRKWNNNLSKPTMLSLYFSVVHVVLHLFVVFSIISIFYFFPLIFQAACKVPCQFVYQVKLHSKVICPVMMISISRLKKVNSFHVVARMVKVLLCPLKTNIIGPADSFESRKLGLLHLHRMLYSSSTGTFWSLVLVIFALFVLANPCSSVLKVETPCWTAISRMFGQWSRTMILAWPMCIFLALSIAQKLSL